MSGNDFLQRFKAVRHTADNLLSAHEAAASAPFTVYVSRAEGTGGGSISGPDSSH